MVHMDHLHFAVCNCLEVGKVNRHSPIHGSTWSDTGGVSDQQL
jgi:hypothetical protein